jgi:Mrp family chromosome partitioning ATPase
MSRIQRALRQMEVQRPTTAVRGPLPTADDTWPALHDPLPTVSCSLPTAFCSSAADDAPSDPRLVLWVDDLLKRFPPSHHAVLMLTSPGPDSNKAGVSAALAESLAARLPGEVLAVSGPIETSEVAATPRVFDDRAGVIGLAGVLAGETTWEDAVCQTPRKWLDVLPSATTSAGRLPAVTGIRLAAVLDDLRRHYRFVVIDGPSLDQPDAVAMASCCDGVFLVVALGQTRRGAAQQAVAILQRGGANALGCVVAGA